MATIGNFISGENLQMMCGANIGFKSEIDSNPRIKSSPPEQFFDLDREHPKEIDNPYTIYGCTHVLYRNYVKFCNILGNFKNPFILVFHNSDYAFDTKHLDLFHVTNHLKHIYTQNINIPSHAKVHPLPIGIANSRWKHGDVDVLKTVIENCLIKRDQNVYLNFQINTNRAKRQCCLEIMVRKGIKHLPNLNFLEYLTLLKSFKFAICPEGNGFDTHRMWECLYLKVIPICARNRVTEFYSKIHPIIILEKWEDLDATKLDYASYSFENYHLLDFKEFQNDLFME
jgi:hypothetical protein